MVAQRYPEDFDGVIAGDSGHVWNHLFFAGIWDIRAFSDDPASYIPPAKLEMVRQAVLDACDAMDGVKDGILTDPRRCHFDPAALLCKNGAGDGCLTQPQVDALKKVYAGPKNSRTGERINFGLEPGIETSMPSVAPGTSRATGNNDLFFRGMGFEDPKWDAQSLNFDEHVAFIDKKLEFMNATNPDLTRFKRRGGKLIQYHGWSDPGVPPLTAVAYFESVMAKTGGEKRTTDFYRLFMAPGMAHCFGGPGPNSFGNLLAPQPLERNDESDIGMALVRWVEHGVAPAKIIAVKFKDDDPQKGVVMTRPLCPYPQVAAWTSKGDTNSAANFVCRAEGQEKKPADRAK
jgi:feruloyl esterase